MKRLTTALGIRTRRHTAVAWKKTSSNVRECLAALHSASTKPAPTATPPAAPFSASASGPAAPTSASASAP
eukprot:3067940-Pleurochrysis_carterae.AAC.1